MATRHGMFYDRATMDSDRTASIPTLPLYFTQYGEPRAERPAVVLLHGLFGSGTNWGSVARRLAERHLVITVDLRNHGRSPHAARMSYPAMAADLAAFLDAHDLQRVAMVGHSMGGKVAMYLALAERARVERLCVVDISPVAYPNRFQLVYDALKAVDLDTVSSRRDADAMLAEYLANAGLRQFLLQNLEPTDGRWRWRFNLAVLEREMAAILAFPQPGTAPVYDGPALFIYGEESNYVRESYRPTIKNLFPEAGFAPIENAGHWVYAEQPEAFMQTLTAFLP